MKKKEAAKKVDKTLGSAFRRHSLETPPVNFADRTMLKLREVEMAQNPAVNCALGKKFKITVGIIFTALLTLMLSPLLPQLKPVESLNGDESFLHNWGMLEKVVPMLINELFTVQNMMYLLAVGLGVLFLVGLERFLKKKLVRLRS